MSKLKTQLLLAGCLLCVANTAIAEEKKVANELFNGDTLAFDFKDNFKNDTVSITGPNGFNTRVVQKEGAPTIKLSNAVKSNSSSNVNSIQTSSLADGLYNYEITVATNKTVEVTDTLNNGRGKNAKTTMNIGETQAGHFRVKDGSIVTYQDIKEGE